MSMVKNVLLDWEEMEGESVEVKLLNALLTSVFIGVRDIPADECVTHARAVLAMYHAEEEWKPKVVAYLKSMFATGTNLKTGERVKLSEYDNACVEAAERMGPILRASSLPDKLVLV
tara:strand:- start:11743 stop:12093 length:351 start_codon:yes stop_codon:yes gene_type:complete